MRTIHVGINEITTTVLHIGLVGEQNHAQIVFDASPILNNIPGATVSLAIQPPVGDIYPKIVEKDGNLVKWVVSTSDCAHEGNGEYQLTFVNGDEIVKTFVGNFRVYNSLIGNGEAPDPIADWVEEANVVLDKVKYATEADLIYDTVTDQSVASVPDGAGNLPVNELVAEITPLQDLHGQDYPYPPGGGKNKADERFLNYYTINTSTGSVESSSGSKLLLIPSGNSTTIDIPIDGSKTYTFSGKALHKNGSSVNIPVRIGVYNLDHTYRNQFVDSSSGDSYTLSNLGSSGTLYLRISVGLDAYEVQLEEGSSATDWMPYSNICPFAGRTECNIMRSGENTENPTVYNIIFPEISETFYGGTLTVYEDGTGQLALYWKKDTITNITDAIPLLVDGGYIMSVTEVITRREDVDYNAYSLNTFGEVFKGIRPTDRMTAQPWVGYLNQYGQTNIHCDKTTTQAEARAAILNTSIVYKVKDPIIYNLTGLEVVKMLTGVNNVWCDTGNILKMEYPCNLKLYIDKKLS